jgi:DGQHR domain-containing protein
MATTGRRRARKSRKRLSATEKEQRQREQGFKVQINTIFKNAGFQQIATRNHEFTFAGRTGEIDSLFLFENILVVSEDTCLSTANLKDHINAKAVFFRHILDHAQAFIEFLEREFEAFKAARNPEYDRSEYRLVFLYCSQNQIQEKDRQPHGHITFFNITTIRYFQALTKVIHRSARYELFKSFKLTPEDIGHTTGAPWHVYSGFLLPEAPSGFPKDYKIATFYIDPDTLIRLAYVLRKDNWEDRDGLYQRMLIRSKIASMRQYLAAEERVFVNNVIVSLPNTTRLLDPDGRTISPAAITKTTPVQIDLPKRFDSIGLIDGQHRVFSYHEGTDESEAVIKAKRVKQQLLVTGIVFPTHIDELQKRIFEAKLFLEINDKQSRAKGDLKQAIQTIVEPYHPVAIAKSIITRLAKDGPLAGLLQDHYFGDGKIKTTSIVSYALRHIVGFAGDPPQHSLYNIWQQENKARLRDQPPDSSLRDDYVAFCAEHINDLLSGFKRAVGVKGWWSSDMKKSRALTITTINGLIYCLRILLEKGQTGSQSYYFTKFDRLRIDFSPSRFKYKSSHWKSLGLRLYDDCFK